MSEIENKIEEQDVSNSALEQHKEADVIDDSVSKSVVDTVEVAPVEVQKRKVKAKADYLDGLDDEHRDLLVSLKNGDISSLYNKIKDYVPERYDNFTQEELLREKLIVENPTLSSSTIEKMLKSTYGIGISDDRLDMMSEDELERFELAREVDAERAKSLLKSKIKNLDTSKFSFEKEIELEVDDYVDEDLQKEQQAQLDGYYKYWEDSSDKDLSELAGINLDIQLGENETYSLKYDIEQESLDGIKKLVKDKGGIVAVGELIGKRDDKGNVITNEQGLFEYDPKAIFELLLLKQNRDGIFKKAISEAKTETRINKVKEIKNINNNEVKGSNISEPSIQDRINYIISNKL